MKRPLPIQAVAAALLALTFASSTVFAADKKVAVALGDPTKLPPEKAQKLVDTGKVFAFYDPANLSRPPVLSAKSALLMDYDTGEILWEKNGTARRYPASTTKILTGLLLAERTQPNDVITCMDPKIREIEPSSLHIQPWEKFTSRDLLYGTMLRSANDGSVVIAQHLAGSVKAFSEMMNQRAREMGATDTHFTNPNGLPDKEHWTTARDLALISRAAMQNERFSDAVSQRKRKIARSKAAQDVVVSSKAKRYYDTFPGADGIKTGYTRAARHCFVASATRGGRRLIGVILGAEDNASGESMPLLSWGFRRFPAEEVAREGATVAVLKVRDGVAPDVQAVAAGTLRTFRDAVKAKHGGEEMTTEVRGADRLYAPVRQGQEVGALVVKVGGKERGTVPLLAATDVAVAPSLPEKIGQSAKGIPTLLGTGVGVTALVALGYGTATAKSARRRRNRFSPQGRGDDRPRSGQRRR